MGRTGCDFEHVLRVEQPGVDFLRRQVRLAHYENLCALVTRRLRLGGLHLLEELLEHPQQRVVVLAAEYFGYEPSTSDQEFAGELQGQSACEVSRSRGGRGHTGCGAADLEGVQREFGLVVGVFGPGATSSDVGRTIVEHDFSLMPCQGGSQARARVRVYG
jgi:hypothetical protein